MGIAYGILWCLLGLFDGFVLLSVPRRERLLIQGNVSWSGSRVDGEVKLLY